jgi:hypothetical protein
MENADVTEQKTPTFDPDEILAELLVECRGGVRMCFELSSNPDWDDDMGRAEAMSVAARLIKTSIALAAALKKKPEFTHRIIVERGQTAPLPPPVEISGKTIHGGEEQEKAQD